MKKGRYVRGGAETPKREETTTISNLAPTPKPTLSDTDDKGFFAKHFPIFLILIFTFGIYYVNFDNEPTNWDDDKYIDQNPLLKDFSSDAFYRMFFSTNNGERYFMGNYHPLTMLTLNIDYHYSEIGSNGKALPQRFIAVNILLHLLTVLFIYLICTQIFRRRLYWILIPLIFAVHTLHVESVTWISERKDVLYAMFYFCALWLYILYKKKDNLLFYIGSLIVFILSALSKGQAVSLTFSVILVDYFLTNNYFNWKTHLNKIPYLLISVVFGLISIEAQKASTALSEVDQYYWWQRIAFGSYGFVQYILRLILPVNLANLYPYPDIINRTVPPLYWLAVPVFIGAILLSVFTYKKDKTLTFGVLFFIANIALLLQFIPVGSAMYSDRYSYIPSFGTGVLLAYLIDILINKKNFNQKIIYGIVSVYVLSLSLLTIERIKVWKNSETLWSDCVSKYPEAVIGWNNLGSYINVMADSLYKKSNDSKFIEQKKYAVDCFTQGLKYKPDYTHAFYNRGLANKDIFDATQDTTYEKQALEDYTNALKFDLSFAAAFQNRALIYDSYGERWLGKNKDTANFYFNLALSDYDRALETNPNLWDIYINRGACYGKSGRLERALEELQTYIAHDTTNASAFSNRGLAFSGLHQYQEALRDFDKALSIDSTMEGAYFNKALTYRQMNQFTDAIKCLDRLLRINPTNAQAYYYRGLYKFGVPDRGGACDDFHKALDNNYLPAQEMIRMYCNQ